ncbi:MAG: isopentenyl phosphate kinase [Acidilobaceae archaeon]
MMCKVAVVKLGGSVITKKNVPETIDFENLTVCVEALKKYVEKGRKLVLVLGGGSFGHNAVSKILNSKNRLEATDSSVVQLSMLKLATSVLSKLVNENVPAVLHPPHSLCRDGNSSSCNMDLVIRDLSLGLVPVLFGDVIPSAEDGFRVISGDDIAVEAALAVKADCLIFVTSTSGVLSREGKVLELVESLEQVETLPLQAPDVTGGMIKKVEKALKASRAVENIRIVGLKYLSAALEGLNVGTRVRGKNDGKHFL